MHRCSPKGRLNAISRARLDVTYTLVVFWAAEYRFHLLLDQEGYLRKGALRVTWPSFGNTTVMCVKGIEAGR
jgi:hypothetical protein